LGDQPSGGQVRRVAPPWKKPRPTVWDFAGRGFYPGTVTREHTYKSDEELWTIMVAERIAAKLYA
jgi:hypothetical protein